MLGYPLPTTKEENTMTSATTKTEAHARFFELETQALLEVGYFDENGKPKQGPEGQSLIHLAYENLRKQGIYIPGWMK